MSASAAIGGSARRKHPRSASGTMTSGARPHASSLRPAAKYGSTGVAGAAVRHGPLRRRRPAGRARRRRTSCVSGMSAAAAARRAAAAAAAGAIQTTRRRRTRRRRRGALQPRAATQRRGRRAASPRPAGTRRRAAGTCAAPGRSPRLPTGGRTPPAAARASSAGCKSRADVSSTAANARNNPVQTSPLSRCMDQGESTTSCPSGRGGQFE